MKKIIIKILLILSIFSISGINIVGNTYAGEDTANNNNIKVTVTEKIPGADCECAYPKGDKECEKSIYTCTVEPGFGSVMKMMGSIIKYFSLLAMLGGVLFIVYNGIMYSMGGADQSLKDNAKKRIIQTLIGLILLWLSGPILNLIAPWVFVK